MPHRGKTSNDSLHRYNCSKTFARSPPKPWEFLYYIPNPLHPLEDDDDCSAHFCLVLPDEYKRFAQRSDQSYRAVALITRKPRSSTKAHGCMVFRPHTAHCTCPKRSGELETSVVNRASDMPNQGPKVIVSTCSQYNRTDPKNKGHFETFKWFDDSVIPVQPPKMVHVDSLHLMRPLTQPRFGVTLLSRSVLMFEGAFKGFKERSETIEATMSVGQNWLATGGSVPWSHITVNNTPLVQ